MSPLIFLPPISLITAFSLGQQNVHSYYLYGLDIIPPPCNLPTCTDSCPFHPPATPRHPWCAPLSPQLSSSRFSSLAAPRPFSIRRPRYFLRGEWVPLLLIFARVFSNFSSLRNVFLQSLGRLPTFNSLTRTPLPPFVAASGHRLFLVFSADHLIRDLLLPPDGLPFALGTDSPIGLVKFFDVRPFFPGFSGPRSAFSPPLLTSQCYSAAK